MITLKSNRLRVEIAEPGEESNCRTRFDRAAFIEDVILDGMIHFGASEPKNLVHPTSGGRGFCSEYRCDVSKEARVSEYFPKFGVGLIRREEEDKFYFYKTYRDVVPFPVSVEHSGNRVKFVTDGVSCLGYKMKSTRTVSVEDNRMVMITEATNTGEKDIVMEEFCHNFISIDGMAVGSDYVLEMPQIPDLGTERLNNRRGFSGNLRGNGRGVTFCEFTAIDTDISIDCTKLEKTVPFIWRMRHKGAKASVEGNDYFIPGKIAIWGVDHILSPEIVHCFTLKPGETHQWKRSWQFDREL